MVSAVKAIAAAVVSVLLARETCAETPRPNVLLIAVDDIKVNDEICYQAFNFLNVFHVILVNRSLPHEKGSIERFKWYVVSIPLIGIFHGWLHRKCRKLILFFARV